MRLAPTAEIITDSAGFTALAPQWAALARNLKTPLASFAWYDACRRFLHPNQEPVVFVVREGEHVRAIAPLVLEQKGRVGRLVPLSQGTGEPGMFLYDSPEALATVCEAITDFAVPVALTHFYADAPEIASLGSIAKSGGRTLHRTSDQGSSRVLLGIDRETLLSGMSSSSRTFMRRKRSIAQRDGPVSFEAVSPDEASLGSYLQEIFRIENSGWKGRAGTSISSEPLRSQFFLDYCRDVAREGILRLFFLRVGEETVAFRMDLEHGRRLWELKIGYDERFSKSSPGIVLMHETLGYACDKGLEAYEFLGNFETWHTHWPIERYGFATLYYYPRTLFGLALFAQDSYSYVRKNLNRRGLFRRAADAKPQESGQPLERD